MGQGHPSTWVHGPDGIRAENGDLVCDAPSPIDCPHLTCNVAKPKVATIDLDDRDREVEVPFPRDARTVLEAVVTLALRWQHAREAHALRHSGDHFTSGRMAGYEQAIALLLGTTQREVRATLLLTNGRL